MIWVETAVAILLVAGRGFLRYQGKERLTVDDGFVFFALLCMIVSRYGSSHGNAHT